MTNWIELQRQAVEAQMRGDAQKFGWVECYSSVPGVNQIKPLAMRDG